MNKLNPGQSLCTSCWGARQLTDSIKTYKCEDCSGMGWKWDNKIEAEIRKRGRPAKKKEVINGEL